MIQRERINNMSNEEFADYINSIFKLGIALGKNQVEIKEEELVNYQTWLEEEC